MYTRGDKKRFNAALSKFNEINAAVEIALDEEARGVPLSGGRSLGQLDAERRAAASAFLVELSKLEDYFISCNDPSDSGLLRGLGMLREKFEVCLA